MRQVRELLGELPHARARRMLDDIAAELSAARLPLATYRVQLHRGFGFRAAAAITGYLEELGITDLYTSPYMRAAPGSNHGYDVLDHQQLNPELGTAEDHAAMCAAARERSLGHVLDIVPNHMGIGSGNSLWMDLLENGPSARAARFFDVEWHPVKEELEDKVLVPILGDRYGAVLERGELKLRLLNGNFQVTYFDHLFPLSPRSYGEILSYRLADLEARLPKGDPSLDELKSILTAIDHLPNRHEQDPDRLEERRREKEVIKRRVAALCATDPRIREHLEENVVLYSGVPGKPRSFDLLDKLLGAQAYRLAHWRVSSEEINYRRFFDINSLAAIRVEDPVVFEEAHRLPLRFLAQGLVTGFRVDHPDGLAYPTRYFRLLQDSHILDRARALAEGRGEDWKETEPAVREELAREISAAGTASPLYKPVFVVAEKILAGTERLPESWAVRGTTGYDFLNQVNGLFVDTAARDAMDKIYSKYIGGRIDFDELVYQKKKLILYTALASEMNLLARQLNRISEANRWTRDFTLYSLRAALIEVVACFPVYRTYVGDDGTVDERDRKYVLQAVACAKRRNPAENASIYQFIADILLQKFADYVVESERPLQLAFVIKLQQVLGPVMAKGLEDTVFYVYNRLLSLNEVGGEPNRFGVTVQQFHAANELRARSFPRTLLATATHDTKRGEDVRTRIDALSEMPKEWASVLSTWTRKVEGLLRDVEGRKAPDRNELMLFFQTLVGMWPNGLAGELPKTAEMESLSQRLQQYMFKAVKEAKVNTSWIQEDKTWEEAVQAFVRDLFALPRKHGFWKAFLPFADKIARIGAHNSLSQLALKLASPGVPDIYQGTELWDLSLVDPDNRRPVDFEQRMRILEEIRDAQKPRAAIARELYEAWPDGRIKLLLTQAGLRARRDNPAIFGDGQYMALEPQGNRADRLIAFARTESQGGMAICIAPRLVAGLLESNGLLPAAAFSETTVPVPSAREGLALVDAFTGERCVVKDGGIRVSDAFANLPVALLLTE